MELQPRAGGGELKETSTENKAAMKTIITLLLLLTASVSWGQHFDTLPFVGTTKPAWVDAAKHVHKAIQTVDTNPPWYVCSCGYEWQKDTVSYVGLDSLLIKLSKEYPKYGKSILAARWEDLPGAGPFDTLPSPVQLPNDTVKCVLKTIYIGSNQSYSIENNMLTRRQIEEPFEKLQIVQAVYTQTKVSYWYRPAQPTNAAGQVWDLYIPPEVRTRVDRTLLKVIGVTLPEYYELIPLHKIAPK